VGCHHEQHGERHQQADIRRAAGAHEEHRYRHHHAGGDEHELRLVGEGAVLIGATGTDQDPALSLMAAMAVSASASGASALELGPRVCACYAAGTQG
jgi:hypothetical protein